jgi:heme A synthase
MAIITACATWVLLLIGGLVHNTRSSLACPDWPLCFGQVMPKMVGGVAYEHSHRLAATTVGLLTLALAALMWRRGRPWRGRGLAAALLVVFQGVLGGITVIFRLPPLVSTTHLGTSLIFFAYLIWLAFRMSEGEPVAIPSPLRRWIGIALAFVYVQSLVGALMRHLGAGLACVDLPLCRGSLWPTGAHPVVQLHALHRWLAIVAGVVVIAVAVRVGRAACCRKLRALAAALVVIVLGQIALGVASILLFLDALPVTAHLGGAALLVAGLVSMGLSTRSAESVPARVAPTEGVPA